MVAVSAYIDLVENDNPAFLRQKHEKISSIPEKSTRNFMLILFDWIGSFCTHTIHDNIRVVFDCGMGTQLLGSKALS